MAGQILLAVCCGFYIPWWFMVFRPGQPHNWMAGRAGILLLLTFLAGLAGLVLTLWGDSGVGADRALFSGNKVMALGIAICFLMMIFTSTVFHRPVTTELLLITGWAVLELVTVNKLYGTEIFERPLAIVLCALIAAAFIVNMVLYIAYYRLDAWNAYRLAAVPLAVDGVYMAALAAVIVRLA